MSTKSSAKSALPPKRDHHGPNRSGLPPPPTFDFDGLADGTLLSELETAAVIRNSPHTLASWRLRDDRRRDPRLPWLVLPNRQIRYTVGSIRAYLALGRPGKTKPKPPTTAATAKPARAARRRRGRPRTAEAVQEA